MGKSAASQRPKRKPLYGKLIELPDQTSGFIEAVGKIRNLDDLSTKQWYVLSGIYRGLKQQTPKEDWVRDWARAKQLRKGLIQRAAPLVRALVAYEVIWIEMRKRWARTTGYNAERERERKAKDPEAYRRANTERQRRRRARLELAKQSQAPSNDREWDGQAAAE